MDVMALSETKASEAEIVGASPFAVAETIQETSNENKFQKAIATWRGIDLSALVQKLDETVSEIVAHQRDALVERKELAQKTKDFRKLDDTAKLTDYKGLLKAYQGFIDTLTNHGKTSSSAFLNLYSTFADAPDPFPLLEASVESLVISEDTIPKLTSENEELQKRVKKLTTQLDETEQRLESESTSRKRQEEGSNARVQEVESTWAKVLEEKQSNWEAKEKAFEEKVENQDRLLKELKAGYEVAQRLDKDGSATEAALSSAAAAELEILTLDLEKTSARLAEMEARNEQLRVDLAHAASQSHSGPSVQSVQEDPAFVRLQTENSSLLRKLETAAFEKETEKRDWENKSRQLDRASSSLNSENTDLRSKIQKWSDYEEIKRELNMLRSIELSTGDDEDEIPAPDPTTNGSAHGEKKESLEQLLLGRNKKLSSELTLLRVSHQELQQQFSSLQEELSKANFDLEKAQQVSATLENDLMKIQEEAANVLPSSGMSVAGTYTSRYPQGSRRGRSSPTSSIISGYETQSRTASSTLESLRAGEPVGGGSGILPMIQAQRDRFKQKNSQLEEELSKTYATVTALRQEVASLQKDNLNLYEKTRYVSTYSRGANPTTSSSAYSQGTSHTSIDMSGEADSVLPSDRYRSQYEAKISPFAAFRGRESARAYKRMTLPERILFSITRMVLATRTSRNLFAAYCLGLHCLIFFMLYWTGTTDVEKHATLLGEAAAVVGSSSLGGLGSQNNPRQQEEAG